MSMDKETIVLKKRLLDLANQSYQNNMFTFSGFLSLHEQQLIEEIRKEKGIRQEEFAKSMGVSRQTISSLENGRYNPSILLAYKIAKYFEMTIEEVFCFDEEDLT